MVASGLVFTFSDNYWLLLVASIFGVISPSGNDVGPFKAIEEATITQLISPSDRSAFLAWYFVLGSLGAAAGTISCGWGVESLQARGYSAVHAYQLVFATYAGMGLLKAILTLLLNPHIDSDLDECPAAVESNDERRPLIGKSRNAKRSPSPCTDSSTSTSSQLQSIWKPSLSTPAQTFLVRFSMLLALDQFGSGLLSTSWQILYFSSKFKVSEGPLGTTFFATHIVSCFSNLLAIPFATRVGLVRTMVTGHSIAAIVCVLLPLPPTFTTASLLLLVRSLFLDFDQSPRQAFIAAATLPKERMTVMGILNVVKTMSQSLGIAMTGRFAENHLFWLMFVLAGGLKLVYDALVFVLYMNFEERDTQLQEHDEGCSNSTCEYQNS